MTPLSRIFRFCADYVAAVGPRLRRGQRFFEKSCEERCSSRSSEYLKQEERGWPLLALPLVLAACGGGDALSSQSASEASASAASRDAAQEGRILNPDGMACIRANATLSEWAIIVGQDANGEAMLQTVLDREDTKRCFRQNRVTVYL